MRKNSSQSPFEKVTILLFFLGIVFSVTHKLWAYDVWWHLKTGEWIFKHHRVPFTDLYSYTAAAHPWIDLSWGFQLLIYIFYRLLGINGIILFKVFIVTLTFFLLFRFFYRKLDLLLLFPILSLALMTAHERLVERPEVLSYLFLVVYLLLLEKERQKETQLVYLLPLLQILWVNSHGLFILGLLTLGTTCLGETLSWIFSKRKNKPFPTRSYLLLALSCLGTLVNPYGLRGTLFPFTLFTRISGQIEMFTLGIGEFTRPLANSNPSLRIFLYKSLLLLTPISFLLNYKRFSPAHGFLFLSFTYLSLLARRNIAPFSFVSSFLILKNLEDFFQERSHLLKTLKTPSLFQRIRPAGEGILFAFTFLLPLSFVTDAFYEYEGLNKKRFGLGISEHRFYNRAVDFIQKINLQGNCFNSGLDVGDYLIWHFYPERKIFMDGRLEVYGDSFFQELFQLFNAPSLWPKWVERYQINFCILDHTSQKHENLLRWLTHASDWSPIYLDAQVVIFIKKAPENRKLLDLYTIDLVQDPIPSLPEEPESELPLADFYGKIGIFDRAEPLYRKNLSHFPRNAAIYHNFGNLLHSQGKTDEALSAYRQAVTLKPKNSLFRYSLGDLYLDMGKDELALKEFQESLRRSSHFGEARYQLGRLYEKKGWLTEAEKEYRRVSVASTVYLSARNALGILYAERGEFEKAEKEFKDILKVNPSASGAFKNLKRLERLKGKQ